MFRVFSLGYNKIIHDIRNAFDLQVSDQEPSMSSKYPYPYQTFHPLPTIHKIKIYPHPNLAPDQSRVAHSTLPQGNCTLFFSLGFAMKLVYDWRHRVPHMSIGQQNGESHIYHRSLQNYGKLSSINLSPMSWLLIFVEADISWLFK